MKHLVIYSISLKVAKIFSFQHVVNIKVTNEIVFIFLLSSNPLTCYSYKVFFFALTLFQMLCSHMRCGWMKSTSDSQSIPFPVLCLNSWLIFPIAINHFQLHIIYCGWPYYFYLLLITLLHYIESLILVSSISTHTPNCSN